MMAMKIESAEMRFLHSVAGYTLLNQKQNTNIRSVLKTCNITERTEKKKKTAMKIFYDCQ
jgi:hypothetical protein